MSEIRIKRLKQLSYMLKNHHKLFKAEKKPMRFDIQYWFDPGKPDYTSDKAIKPGISCGTAACALGSAALYPPFKKAGLKFMRCDSFFNEYVPMYKDFVGFYAGDRFFKISSAESRWLFDPQEYRRKRVAPSNVAKRVDRLIKHYQKENKPLYEWSHQTPDAYGF